MDIKKYLGYVLYLEKQKYAIDRAIARLTEQCRKLGIKKDYAMPKYVDSEQTISISDCLWGGGLLAFVGAIVVFIIGIIGQVITDGSFFTWETWGMCVLGIFIFGVCMTHHFLRAEMNDELEKYKDNMKIYDLAVEQDKVRVAKELQDKRKVEVQIESLKYTRDQVLNTLEIMYSMNVLYPKYRNLVAVATMYEYFDSGRCTLLEGHEGAYNIYENEIRLNVILSKLSDILSRLEDIKNNQMTMYNTIKEGNRLTNQLCGNTERLIAQNKTITENTAITAYNSEITAANTEIMKFIAIYSKLK